LSEINSLKADVEGTLDKNINLDKELHEEIMSLGKKKVGLYHGNFFVSYYKNYLEDRKSIKRAKSILNKHNIAHSEYKSVIHLLKEEISYNRKIERLKTMQNLLKYWHVAHLPFAFVMLIVMIVHVVIAIMFGSKWIF
jgi:endonuclease III-like uncharacterized protein